MAKKPQIPLNDVMLAIDRKNKSWYDNLSDEQKKAFSAWMMMRYASSVQGGNAASYLFMVNEVPSGLLEVHQPTSGEWKCVSTKRGALCVTTPGASLMPWCSMNGTS